MVYKIKSQLPGILQCGITGTLLTLWTVPIPLPTYSQLLPGPFPRASSPGARSLLSQIAGLVGAGRGLKSTRDPPEERSGEQESVGSKVFSPTKSHVSQESPLTPSLCYPSLSPHIQLSFKRKKGGFSGGSVVKNPPANAGHTGSIPALGRSHMSWSNEAHVPQLLSLCSRARGSQLLKPTRPRAHAGQQEKLPKMRSLHITTRE